MIRTRFAPSPTGDLHLGGAWTALASWAVARRGGGAFVLRMEDLDPPRIVRGSAVRIEQDLRWLGLDWDEGPGMPAGPTTYGPYAQSERAPLYEAVVAHLTARALTYPCDCSRSEIARTASAPHPGEETVYPGTCRDLDPDRPMKRDPAIRLRVPERSDIRVEDGAVGVIEQNVARQCGDFVLRRADGGFAYQLAVVVDDLAMRVSDVIRGADLALSTPRQVLLATLLGGGAPRYTHLPLVVASDGTRLAKRTGGASVRALREAGVDPREVVGRLAHGLGLTPDDGPRSVEDLAEDAGPIRWARAPWRVPEAWAGFVVGAP